MAPIGTIPEFTQDETAPVVPSIPEEVKQEEPVAPTEQIPPETVTPAPPAEKPDEVVTPPVEGTPAPLQPAEDDPARAIQGLQNERVKLLKEISELKGQKREIKQGQLDTVQKQIDELKDLHPEDVATIDRVLRAKGFITKEEANGMFYEAVKNEELTKFLDKYPEYKPENDPGDVNWQTLQRELGFYRMPEDPRQITQVLERAHRNVVKVPATPSIQPLKRRVETAGVGGQGVQRSTPTATPLDPARREMLLRGGWSEEEVQKIEQRLT